MKRLTYFFLLLFITLAGCNPATESDDLILIGHRGATGLLPENTIPGFKKALEYNVDGIEMDVVVSGDHQVVVSHEPYFRHDLCLTPEGDSISVEAQKEHRLYEMDYRQIAQYDCGSLQRPGYPDQQTQPLSKPLLSEVIQEMEQYIAENELDPITYNVEIKSKPGWDGTLQPHPDTTVALTYDVLSQLDVLDRSRIFAFDVRVLNRMQEVDASIPQVYLISGGKTDMTKNLALLGHKPAVYAPNYHMVDSSLVERAHEQDMQVIPWTVNNPKDMQRLVKTGVDGMISDYPNLFERLDEE